MKPKSSGEQSHLEQFLCFYVAHSTQAMLPTKQLTEILTISLNQIIPIPDVSPYIMGVCNWRGDVLWLADLAYQIGLEPIYINGYRLDNYHVIIINYQHQTIGLVVRKIIQMQWCDISQIQQPPTSHISGELSAYLRGYWLNSNQELSLILNVPPLILHYSK